jgi:DNA invertase Pin-like site-specific DNA recombinase
METTEIKKPDFSGEKNNHSKLTWEQVREIRKNYIRKVHRHKDIARQYNVSRATISFLLSNKTWAEN